MTSEAIDEAGELAVSQPAIPLDHGDAVGVGGDRTVERGAEGLARPVAASAIPLGDVGGPGDHALEWRRHGAIAYFTLASSLCALGGWSASRSSSWRSRRRSRARAARRSRFRPPPWARPRSAEAPGASSGPARSTRWPAPPTGRSAAL